MAASRLPGKPLLKINNLSIISHVFRKAEQANIGEVVVATEDKEILDDVIKNGGKAILTHKNHKTGTDRVYEAYKKLKIKNVKYILNLQGDEPNIDIEDIINLDKLMKKNNNNIGTLAAEINDISIEKNPNIVKAVIKKRLTKDNFPSALNFIRKTSSKKLKNIYHHIGIYSFKVDTLEKFVNLSQTKNEIENNLEQMRALDNEININVALANSTPIGVDTKEDYIAIKKIMEYK